LTAGEGVQANHRFHDGQQETNPMQGKQNLTLKDLFDLMVDAAVGDAMADRGFEPRPAGVRDRADRGRSSPAPRPPEAGQRAGFRKWLFGDKKPSSPTS
jgi:hypothetical protein